MNEADFIAANIKKVDGKYMFPFFICETELFGNNHKFWAVASASDYEIPKKYLKAVFALTPSQRPYAHKVTPEPPEKD